MAKAEPSSLISGSFPPFHRRRGRVHEHADIIKAPCVGCFLWGNNAPAALSLSLSSHLLHLRSLAQKRGSDVKGGEQGHDLQQDWSISRPLPPCCKYKPQVFEGLPFPQQVRPRCERQTLLHAVLQLSSPNMLRRRRKAERQHFNTEPQL